MAGDGDSRVDVVDAIDLGIARRAQPALIPGGDVGVRYGRHVAALVEGAIAVPVAEEDVVALDRLAPAAL